MEHPVRTVRKQQSMTLEQVSALAGVNQSTVARIELRIRRGNLDTYRRLGRALGVDWRLLVED